MRRADRLFQIVQLIRGRRLTTAAYLADRLQISPRSVYRDIAQLQHQGVPIEGEAGVGYRLGAGFELPPLMFTQMEAHALVVALRLAQTWLDPALALEAQNAMGKILSVLPADVKNAATSLPIYAPSGAPDAATQQLLQSLREALAARSKLRLRYCDLAERNSERTVWPLGCFYWGRVWTLAAWCETRQDFRSFRVDRIRGIEVLGQRFGPESGKTLADMLRQIGASAAALGT